MLFRSKGQQIAVSGQTGFATAPHLHFQIDREAPFHPYWPFTTTEATEKGYSFVEAVNKGLGQHRSEQYTVNPLAYVEEFRDWEQPGGGALIAGDTQQEEGVKKEEAKAAEHVERSPKETWKLLRDRMRARRAARLARLQERKEVAVLSSSEKTDEPSTPADDLGSVVPASTQGLLDSSLDFARDSLEESIIVSTAETDIPMPQNGSTVTNVTMLHDGDFDKDWEEIVLFARDADGAFVKHVRFAGEIVLSNAFGEAEFAPSALTEEQFDDRGRAFVRMLPRGIKTVIPVVQGVFQSRGEPMVYVPRPQAVTAKASARTGG